MIDMILDMIPFILYGIAVWLLWTSSINRIDGDSNSKITDNITDDQSPLRLRYHTNDLGVNNKTCVKCKHVIYDDYDVNLNAEIDFTEQHYAKCSHPEMLIQSKAEINVVSGSHYRTYDYNYCSVNLKFDCKGHSKFEQWYPTEEK